MSTLLVYLFGRFHIEGAGQPVMTPEMGKAQALLCYLILNRAKPQSRESLADHLWADLPPIQSKKHLRQALYQLHQFLNPPALFQDHHVLIVTPRWVQLNPAADLWIDLAAFESGLTSVQNISGRHLDAGQMQKLDEACSLYGGELLEGCYEDWCLFERERLRNQYLLGLDKLMDYCEAHEAFEAALEYGVRILRHEHARESTHRRMMRLYYRSGDRTAALRQYERCAEALHHELAVNPSASTLALFEQIRSGHLNDSDNESHTIECLKRVQSILADVQADLQREVLSLELRQVE